ncbi:hypothetical protein B0T20DRAFT_44746 [Sordaria brevicollis]|uniref:Uncharacterized protein n=1 Tax=Sordaria brevicollis TaxID=83679 RepID=A0AAE0P9A0_SORBR|nr:hypothetical protein B0T20DRAFT_44746 [Sordaria brevicollis]
MLSSHELDNRNPVYRLWYYRNDDGKIFHTVLNKQLLTNSGPQVYEEAPCPLTTSIVFPDVVLTGVTIQPASSPTSCCVLPTPSPALELIAFEPNATDVDSIYFYKSSNATSPEYVGTLVNGSRCLLDLSPETLAAGRLAVHLSNGESLIFDETGMHYYGAGCNTTTSVTVSDFLAQLAGLPAAPPPDNTGRGDRRVRKRDLPETNFTVAVQVAAAIDLFLQDPKVAFGDSPCAFLDLQNITDWDIHSWTCQYPGANSSEKACEEKFHSWFKPDSTSPTGAGIDQTGNVLFNFVPRLVNRLGNNLAELFPGISDPLQQGLTWLNNAHNAVLHAADVGGGELCEIIHEFDEYDLILSDPGLPSLHTIGNYHSPPLPTITEVFQSHTERITKEPPRQVVPTETGFPNVTETSFAEIPDVPDLAPTEISVKEDVVKAAVTPFTSLGSLLDAPPPKARDEGPRDADKPEDEKAERVVTLTVMEIVTEVVTYYGMASSVVEDSFTPDMSGRRNLVAH